MAIGILALAIGAICLWISSLGLAEVEKPVQQSKRIEYPYPEEI